MIAVPQSFVTTALKFTTRPSILYLSILQLLVTVKSLFKILRFIWKKYVGRVSRERFIQIRLKDKIIFITDDIVIK